MPGQGRRESGRMENAKSAFRPVGVPWSLRGLNVVNNRQEEKMRDEGRVCMSDKGQKKVNLRNEFQKRDYCNEKMCF